MTTTKMNKEQMVQFLDEHFKEVDENLQSRITYTANAWKKDAKAVTSIDLKDLVKEVMEALKPVENAEPAVANSVKKTLKTTKKTAEKAEEKPEEEKPVKEEKAPAKKTVGKKTPKSAVETEKVGDVEVATRFSDTISTEIGELSKVNINSIKELREALEQGEEIYFAFFWSKRLLNQFTYSAVETIKTPKSFNNDVDLVSCIYVSDEDVLALGVSSYTDAPYVIQPEELKANEDGIRISNHMEFEVYKLTPAE